MHRKKSSCNTAKKDCRCVQEIWIAPPPEKKSSWHVLDITKEMFFNQLGLKLSEVMIDSDYNGNINVGDMNAEVDEVND